MPHNEHERNIKSVNIMIRLTDVHHHIQEIIDRSLEVKIVSSDAYEDSSTFASLLPRSVAILTPHGAQVPNSLFTCQNTTVIEFLCVGDSEESMSHNHQPMLDAYGKRYGAIAVGCKHQGSPMVVPPNKVIKLLRHMMMLQ